MELGVYTFGSNARDDATGRPVSSAQAQRNLVEAIKVADEVGLDFFGIGEHHTAEMPASAAATILAAGASLTPKIRLASAVTVLWLTDITEHPTAEGKLYRCAVKDACSNRIVGYSMDSRMTADVAVRALQHAVALRGPAGTVVHSDRGSQFRAHVYVRALRSAQLHGSMDRVGACADTRRWSRSSACSRRTSWTASDGTVARTCAPRSCSGSSRPTTVAGVRTASADSRRLEFETLLQTAHAA